MASKEKLKTNTVHKTKHRKLKTEQYEPNQIIHKIFVMIDGRSSKEELIFPKETYDFLFFDMFLFVIGKMKKS